MLETQIDDLSPQAIAYTLECLLQQGALDAFAIPVTMKKSRLGHLLVVLCWPDRAAECERVLWRETSTLGIRRRLQERVVLPRVIYAVDTPYGPARVKVAWRGEGQTTVQPEYDDCAAIARDRAVPFAVVWEAVRQAGVALLPLEHPE